MNTHSLTHSFTSYHPILYRTIENIFMHTQHHIHISVKKILYIPYTQFIHNFWIHRPGQVIAPAALYTHIHSTQHTHTHTKFSWIRCRKRTNQTNTASKQARTRKRQAESASMLVEFKQQQSKEKNRHTHTNQN